MNFPVNSVENDHAELLSFVLRPSRIGGAA